MKKTLFRIFKGILIFLLIVLAIAGGILAYNMWLNQTFVTTFYTVTTDKDIENMRIVELSDLHLREYGEKNADLVERIRNLKPDIIAVAGDMNIDENPDYAVVLELMEQLVEIAPVYYGPGNHEWAGIYGWHYSAMADDIAATGAHFLLQQYEDVEINGNKLRIGGIFEWPREQLEWPNSQKVVDALDAQKQDTSDVYTILICHCPEVFYTSLQNVRVDLGISGHAHGGLVRLPHTDGLWSTSQGFLPKYTSGVRQIGESTVVISRGLGDSEPYPRIFNQPELVVIDVEKS